MYYLDEMIGFKPTRKANGQFVKGHTPATKGRKWDEWLTPEKQAKIRASMPHIGHTLNPNCGKAKIPIIVIKDDKELWFESISAASRALKLNERSIRNVLNGKRHEHGGYKFKRSYQQQH